MSAEFIQLVSDLHFQRFNVHLSQLVKEKVPCGVFFGFNIDAKVMKNFVRNFKGAGLNVTCACVIADIPSQAKALKNIGVPVVPLEDFQKFGDKNFKAVKPQVVFIPDVVKDLAFVPYFSRFGIESLSPLGMNTQEQYFLLVMKCLPELYRTYNLFDEAESRKTYRAVIRGRLTGRLTDYHFAQEPQYFLEGFTPSEGDIAIDGGAFDGATSAAFAKCGAKVFAFEMDEVNYRNCLERAEKFGFTIENYGLSNRESMATYIHNDSNPAGSRRSPDGGGCGRKIH